MFKLYMERGRVQRYVQYRTWNDYSSVMAMRMKKVRATVPKGSGGVQKELAKQ
jgi:hypothetical protein